jgi:signal transduction histidine kinase
MTWSTWSPLRRTGRDRGLPPVVVDGAVALVLFGVVAADLAGTREPGSRAGTVVAYLLIAAFTLPYAVHRAHPIAVLTVCCVATVLYATGHFAGYPGFAMFVLVLGLALHARGGRSGVFYLAGLVTLSISLALQSTELVTVSTWLSTVLVLTVAWLAGENLRGRQARWEALEERARNLEAEREERARLAVAEERMRIARELHDVVAHSMSVVAVQAGVAHHVIDRRPELAQEALAAIETTSRAALVELRRMLGVLREPGDAGSFEPSAGLADLHGLVAQLADAGVRVALEVTGDPDGVPSGVGLSAYRIAQESLTNVLKHGADRARLAVACRPSEVVVEVTDPGRRGAGADAVPGAEHGLLGMRERVALFGGRLTAGPDGRGGFRVVATLPYDERVAPVQHPAGARGVTP